MEKHRTKRDALRQDSEYHLQRSQWFKVKGLILSLKEKEIVFITSNISNNDILQLHNTTKKILFYKY